MNITFTMSQSRSSNLDALKGLAVVFMIFQHLAFWLWQSPRSTIVELFSSHPVIMSFNTTGGISAAIFILTSGIGYGFFLSKSGKTIQSVKRGIFLIFCGYIMNLLTPSWFTIGSWYVLHCIGFMILLSPVLSRLRNSTLLVISIIVILAAPIGQFFLATPSTISNVQMGMYSRPWGFLRLMLFEGHFPVSPWASFFIIGLLVHRIITEEKLIKTAVPGVGFLLAGTIFAIAGMIIPMTKNSIIQKMFYVKTNFYPANPPLIFVLLGGAVIFSFIALSLPALKQKNPLVSLGKISLTVFAVHVIIFREGSRRFNFFQRLSEMETITVMVSVVLIFMTIAYLWEKIGFTGSLEWLMRKVAR